MTCSDSSFTIPEEEDTEDMCQAEREWGMEKYKEGYEKGLLRVAKLVNILLSEKRLEDVKRAVVDKGYRDRLLREFKLDC